MHHFLIAEPNEKMLRTLIDVLNCVDIGIILLSRDLHVRFINDRQIELFGLPPALLSTGPHFPDLVAFAAASGRIELPTDGMEELIAEQVYAVRGGTIRPTRLTLANDVRVLFSCKPCLDGGRVLTYAEISQELNREAQYAMENVTAELRFRTEMLEEQGHIWPRWPRQPTKAREKWRSLAWTWKTRSPNAAIWRRTFADWLPRTV
jgi:hypothetical protein